MADWHIYQRSNQLLNEVKRKLMHLLFVLQQEKIQSLQVFADQLIGGEHYDADAIEDKRDQVLDRWSKLKDALIDNRSKLGEAQTLQQFSRDADEMENWLQEKLQIASDESYKDPANIQVSTHTQALVFNHSFKAPYTEKKISRCVTTPKLITITWGDI